MIPARIPDHTRSLPKPDGWDDEANGPCATLYIRDAIDEESGFRVMQSAWEAVGEEAGWMVAGGHLQLGIVGSAHPPVSFATLLPPEDSPPAITMRPIIRNGAQVLRVDMYVPARSDPPAAAANYWSEVAYGNRELWEAAAQGLQAIEHMRAKRVGLAADRQTG